MLRDEVVTIAEIAKLLRRLGAASSTPISPIVRPERRASDQVGRYEYGAQTEVLAGCLYYQGLTASLRPN